MSSPDSNLNFKPRWHEGRSIYPTKEQAVLGEAFLILAVWPLSKSTQTIGELPFPGPLNESPRLIWFSISNLFFTSQLNEVPANIFRRGRRWPTESIQRKSLSKNFGKKDAVRKKGLQAKETKGLSIHLLFLCDSLAIVEYLAGQRAKVGIRAGPETWLR